MRPLLLYGILALCAFGDHVSARKTDDKVLLSKVQALTLYQGKMTAHRRVPAVEQLKCVGGAARGIYAVDVMRCKNMGSDYGDEDVQWTCSASLPDDFKLGQTDVTCEGYSARDDPYILKGSCGVEYTLHLTEKGEQKYGRSGGHGGTSGWDWSRIFFVVVFACVALWIVYSIIQAHRNPSHARRPGHGDHRGGGGGGNDPPPPYPGYYPPGSGYRKQGSNNASQQPQQGWRPGFWSGALGGLGAGYLAGSQQRRSNSRSGPADMNYGTSGPNWGGSSSRSSSASSSGSARHESTGFGSTSRR